MTQVLVTGSTGKIGGELVARLAQIPRVSVRALARNETKAKSISGGAEIVIGDMMNPDQVRTAVRDIDVVVLVTPVSVDAAEQASIVIGEARRAGVTKIVRLSANKADVHGPTDNTRLHGRTDAEIAASGLRYVVLRPNRLMQYTLLAIDSIRRDGAIRSGHANGRLGMVDQRDVIDCLERAVLTDDHNSQMVELTGPQSISFQDVALVLSRVLERPVRYVTIPPDAVREIARTRGFGDWYAQVICDYNKAHSEGWGDFTTDGVERICSRAPRSFETFAREVFAPKFNATSNPTVIG